MSALPPIADISWRRSDVHFVPIADIPVIRSITLVQQITNRILKMFMVDSLLWIAPI